MLTEREDGDAATLFERSLGGLVEFACRWPVLILTCTVLTVAASLYLASTRLEFHTQRSDLISPRKEYVQRWQKHLAEFGDDDDMVVVVQGASRERMVQALEKTAQQIAEYPQLFDRLFYKCDLRGLRDRALLYLPAEQISQIQNNLDDMRLLLEGAPLINSWSVLSLASLLDEGARRLPGILEDRVLRPSDATFLTQLNSISSVAAKVVDDPASYSNPWQSILPTTNETKDQLAEPQYFFSGDDSLAFLLARPVMEAGSFTAAKPSVDKLREIVANIAKEFSELQFGCTGLPVLETDEMVASQDDTNAASWLALAGVCGLYLIVFRGIRYPLMTVATLLTGTAWAMGWLTLTVGHLNILSATFAVMLIGMGDYGVLWVTRYEQERAGGLDLIKAMRVTAQDVGPSILTAALTTALAFYAAMLADFQAVAELGWIAGSGVLLCALACFFVMPAALRLFDRRTDYDKAPASIELRSDWLPRLVSRPRSVIAVSLTATVVFAYFALKVSYDHNLLHLQATHLDSVKWEQTLIEHTAGASWHALSCTATPEDALALKARYEALPGVSRVVEVASLVPLGQGEKIEQLRDIKHRLRKLPERGSVIAHGPSNVKELQVRTARIISELRSSGNREVHPILVLLAYNIEALQDRLAHANAAVAVERLRQFDDFLARDLADDLHKLHDVSTPSPIVLAELPVSLRERFVGQSGKWLVRAFAKESLWEFPALIRFVDQIGTVDTEATGKPFATLEGLRSMKAGFQWAGLYALIAIVLVFYLDFRSLMHTLIALSPLAMGMIAALGIMSLFGLPLNPANMIAFPLILGVGADNGVHVLHDYLHHRGKRRYSLGRTTGRGIMVAALTTILGFGTLMISGHRGLASLGFILTLGVTCCMLTALVFLPAVLRLCSNRHMRHSDSSKIPQIIDPERLAA